MTPLKKQKKWRHVWPHGLIDKYLAFDVITGPLTSRVCACCLLPSSYNAEPPQSPPLLLHALPLCFASVCQFGCLPSLQPLCLLSPRHSSFILHLFVSICLPASSLLQLLPPPLTQALSLLTRHNFISRPQICVFSFLLQWSHGFYLTHNQGQSGFEFFFKTKELKKKWLEQFGMAM